MHLPKTDPVVEGTECLWLSMIQPLGTHECMYTLDVNVCNQLTVVPS